MALKISRAFALLIVIFTINRLHAADPLLEKVRAELSDRIYPASSVVNGYERPILKAPAFAVADLRVENDALFAWSKAISEILRQRIHFTPGVKLRMPDSSMMYFDSQINNLEGLLIKRSAFKTLNESHGIETILSGSLEMSSETISLKTELIDAHSGALVTEKVWKFQIEELPLNLIDISMWVYQSLGIELSASEIKYIQNHKTLGLSAIESYVSLKQEFRELPDAVKFQKLNELHKQNPEFVLFAVEALKHRINSLNDAEAFENLEYARNLRAKFPDNAGVIYRSIKAIEIFGLPKNVATAEFNELKKLIKENPNDANFILDLGYGLVENSESPEGISMMLEAVERWPDTYRSWWALSWALNKYAWQIRGDKFWRDVPTKSQEKFMSLSILSDICTDKALSMYSKHGMLWVQKLSALGSRDGYSDELIDTFNKAIKIAPGEQRIYTSAMNFSQDQWGGNGSIRLHIATMAKENNPDEFWPDSMKERYISASDEVIGKFNLNNLIRFFKKLVGEPQTWKIGILLSFVYAFGKWRGSKQVRVVSDYQYHEEDY